MVDIPFPPSSAPGMRLQEGGGRLINAFAEKAPVGAPAKVIHRRSPGLRPRVTAASQTDIHTRGFLDVGGEILWVVDEKIKKFNSIYSVTDLGTLSGTEPVTLARNNAGPPDNVAVTENGCFKVFSNAPPASFGGVLPGSPTSVCDFDGYFVWSFGDGKIYASDLNSTNVNALSFNTEHGMSVRRVVRFAGRLYAFGDKWTGVYRDAGTLPFPFAREVTIPRGIVGTHAVAGWEAGWANELIWAGDDFKVYKLNGYTPVPISPDAVSRDISRAVLSGNRDFIEAFVYMYGESAFWVLSSHEQWTWEYNLTTGEWNERQSYNRNNWKGMKSVRAFDLWHIGDEYTGELYTVSGTFFYDGTDPLIWHVESGAILQFPQGVVIPRASFHITSGVGSMMSEDPKVEISWSLDGGYSFGQPVIRRLGKVGETRSYPSILNSGLSKGQGVRYRLRVSDPVHVGMMGGVINPDVRADAN